MRAGASPWTARAGTQRCRPTGCVAGPGAFALTCRSCCRGARRPWSAPVSVLALVRFLQGVDVMAATRDGGRGLGFASNPAAQLPMLIFVALRGDDLLRRP